MSNDAMKDLVLKGQSKLAEIAPKWLSVDRVVKLALVAASRTPKLAECTKESMLAFCMKCAETGLEPIGAGGCWPVPFFNKKISKMEVQYIADWRGLIQLAKRTEQIKHAYGEVVCENDEIDYVKGDSPRLDHRPSLKDRGKPIGAYCVVVLPDDSKHIEYMTKSEIDSIRARSKAAESGPWVTDWGQMAIKTVVKRALKPFAASPQLQSAMEIDNAATGLDLVPDRPPVAMPHPKQALPAAETVPEAPENEPEPRQNEPEGGNPAPDMGDAYEGDIGHPDGSESQDDDDLPYNPAPEPPKRTLRRPKGKQAEMEMGQ